MKSLAGKQRLVWRGLVILLAVMSLLQLLIGFNAWVWAVVLGAAGLGVFVVYLTDRSDWGWLIPTYVMWVAAGLIALTELNVLQDEAIGGYTLLAVAIPLLVVNALNPRQRGVLSIGLITGVMGLVIIVAQATTVHAAAAVLLLAGAWILARQFVSR